jgi:hypothetical protein
MLCNAISKIDRQKRLQLRPFFVRLISHWKYHLCHINERQLCAVVCSCVHSDSLCITHITSVTDFLGCCPTISGTENSWHKKIKSLKYLAIIAYHEINSIIFKFYIEFVKNCSKVSLSLFQDVCLSWNHSMVPILSQPFRNVRQR